MIAVAVFRHHLGDCRMCAGDRGNLNPVVSLCRRVQHSTYHIGFWGINSLIAFRVQFPSHCPVSTSTDACYPGHPSRITNSCMTAAEPAEDRWLLSNVNGIFPSASLYTR